MAGNAAQWTADTLRDSYAGAPVDGTALGAESYWPKTIRGGAWSDRADALAAAARGGRVHDAAASFVGFRIVKPQ
jgi:formylglycine-generating enzyme required for sulfatase activity